MQCNIDAKGKALRLTSGIIVSMAGVVLLALAMLGVATGNWAWITGILLIAFGGFQVFEGSAGWCIVRAMGFKTRI